MYIYIYIAMGKWRQGTLMRVVSRARTRAWYDPRLTDGSILSQVNAVISCMYTHVCVCVCVCVCV